MALLFSTALDLPPMAAAMPAWLVAVAGVLGSGVQPATEGSRAFAVRASPELLRR